MACFLLGDFEKYMRFEIIFYKLENMIFKIHKYFESIPPKNSKTPNGKQVCFFV